jgi:hypothetical protein
LALTAESLREGNSGRNLRMCYGTRYSFKDSGLLWRLATAKLPCSPAVLLNFIGHDNPKDDVGKPSGSGEQEEQQPHDPDKRDIPPKVLRYSLTHTCDSTPDSRAHPIAAQSGDWTSAIGAQACIVWNYFAASIAVHILSSKALDRQRYLDNYSTAGALNIFQLVLVHSKVVT